MKFIVPKTLEADFDDFLKTDVPNQVGSFELIHNWYDQPEEPIMIRGEIYPDATKSRYENTDNNLNFRASLKSGIRKGDIIKAPWGTIYLLDWEEFKQVNNIPSRAVRCNAEVTFFRHVPDMVTEDGFLIHEKGEKTIAEDMPCNVYDADNRPDWSYIQYTPGMIPNALSIVSVQLNDYTINIKEGDNFRYFDEVYTVINIDRFGLKMDESSGVLKFMVKKEAGGNDR